MPGASSREQVARGAGRRRTALGRHDASSGERRLRRRRQPQRGAGGRGRARPRRAVEVGDRARDAQDAVVAARAQAARSCSVAAAARRRRGRRRAELAQQRGAQLRVAGQPRSPASRAVWRSRAATTRARTVGRRRRRPGRAAPRPTGRATSTEQVDAVEQRPAEPPAVAREVGRRAAAARRSPHAAGARVRRRDEHEPRRERRRPLARARRDAAVLERLAQRLERRPRELGQLVEEQHAVVGEGRLARRRAARRRRPGPDAEIVWCGARNGRARRPGRRAVQPGDDVDRA